MSITVAYLYPEVMNTYGDRGNVATILSRCAGRGIATRVLELRIGDPMPARQPDLIVLGNGGENGQALIARDLVAVKGQAIKDAVAGGAAALAVGGGFELSGKFCRRADGTQLAGTGLFDAWTVRGQAGAGRAIGDLLVQWGGETLVGFENHGGRTYLGSSARPLGTVLVGNGNNGDGSEGVRSGTAVGTYLRGPCLPRNPALADHLIRAALAHRHGEADLPELADDQELAAHDAAVARVLAAATEHRVRVARIRFGHRAARRPAVVRPMTPRSGQVRAHEAL